MIICVAAVEGTRSREAAALVGRTLGEFVVREPLSSGGFGTVYRAEQPALAREAVIKVLHTRLLGSETMVQRFLREARLASRLDHPYAAHIYAFGAEPDGLLWIAMELVRGTPLDRLLRRCRARCRSSASSRCSSASARWCTPPTSRASSTATSSRAT